MTLINQDIKNLVSGISQQPPILRYPEQLEEQLNGFSSEASGLQKRPPSIFVSKLEQAANLGNKPLIHFINRDDVEQYIVVFTGSDLKVFDLQGNPKTVKFEGDSKSYIYTQDPRFTLKPITIADYTFIANKKQEVAMSQEVSKNVWDAQGLLVNIKSGQYGRTYRIDVNGTTIASHTTPDGSDKSHTSQIATDYIANKLAESCRNNGYTVQVGSSWLYITKNHTEDSSGNNLTIRPSTSPKQQYDRFLGLRFQAGYLGWDPVYQKITLSGDTIIMKGVDGVQHKHDYSHFGRDMGVEIERCKNDHWQVTKTSINEGTGNDSKLHYDTQYTLKYVETTQPGTGTITKTDIKSFSVYDGYNNQAAFGTMRSTQKFTNLPSTAPAGFTVKVAGEEGSNTDDYYVSFDATDQVWKETVRPGLANKFDTATMPHVLVREADGTFTFRQAEWEERDIGDDDSNPEPSFIGQTINSVFYHRNRLGFLSGENVILTRSADFFNFWMTSATEVQDTDPIDLAVSDNTIATLHHAVPFDAELIVFAEDAQFSLQAASVLSPKDAYLTPPLTHFGNSLKATPVNAGRNIYFVAERSQYTTVREYFTATDNTDSKDAQDITSHAPSYVPNGVYKIIPSTIENILLFLTEGEEDSIYVYKYLFIEGARQQAAWSKWNFGNRIYGGAFIDSFLYLVVERNGYFCLEKMSFAFNTTDFAEEPYRVLLDAKRTYKVPAAAYNSRSDETTIDVAALYGDIYDATKPYALVAHDGTYRHAENGIVKLPGNYAETTAIIGITYNFRITVSTIMVKQEKDGSISALTDGRLQLRQFWFNYADSGYFKVRVHIIDKDDYIYENTQRLLGTNSATFGQMLFTTGSFKFPVQSLNTNCIISLESEEPLPLSLIGAGWIGNYVRRTKLY